MYYAANSQKVSMLLISGGRVTCCVLNLLASSLQYRCGSLQSFAAVSALLGRRWQTAGYTGVTGWRGDGVVGWRGDGVAGWRGDGVAQLVERRTRDPKTEGSNLACVRSTRQMCESFPESRMLCWLSVGVPNLLVYTHAKEWSRTHNTPEVKMNSIEYGLDKTTLHIDGLQHTRG